MTSSTAEGRLAIQYDRMRVDELSTFERNPRRGDVDAIADSLHRTGQYRPIVVNAGSETGRPFEVLAGNHTLLAARRLGWEHLDVGIVDVDENTARRIVLADNRTADLGDYDKDVLAEVLSSIEDLVGTGYDAEAYDAAMAAVLDRDGNTDEDDAPELPEAEPVSKPGDVWQLGPHRLLVGDSTDTAEVARMLDGDAPDAIWTDPPYGVEYVGKTKDALRIENDGAAGLRQLLLDAFSTAVKVCRPGAPVYVAHADTERITFETSLDAVGVLVRQNLVWVKNTIVMGRSDYHYKHEPILAGTIDDPDDDGEDEDGEVEQHPDDGGAEDARAASAQARDEMPDTPREHTPMLYGFTPGGKGRLGRGGKRWFGGNNAATVFDFPKPPANRDHPTMKPVALIVAMLDNSLRPGGIVYDPFGGSGSTMIAAHQHGSSARLVELDPRYADVICRRWQQHTSVTPRRLSEAEPEGVPVSFTG